jgi:hypothetical protein
MVSHMRTHSLSSIRFPLLATGVAAAALSSALTATSVGPIAGYKATDTTPYSFIDVSVSGGASVLTSTDDGTAALALPFGFTFFGTSYTNLCVSSNGAAYFNNTAGACAAVADFANTDLSSTPTPGDQASVFPLWSDLVLAGPGAGVFYQVQGAQGSRKFIVQWNNAYPLSKEDGVSPNAMTFEMILFEGSNQILFQYKTVDLGASNEASRGAQATIGIRDAGSVERPPQVPVGSGKLISWSHRRPVAGDGTAILFTVGRSTPVVAVNGGTFTYDGQPQAVTANAYGVSAEPLAPVAISYEGTGQTVYPPTPTAPSDAGFYKAVATYDGNDDYQSASESAYLTIEQASQSVVTVTGPASLTYGAPGAASASGGSGTGAFSFVAAGTGCTLSGTTVAVVDASGTCTLTATRAGDNNYLPSAPSAPAGVTLLKGAQAPVSVDGPSDLTFGTPGTAVASGGSAGTFSFSAEGSTGCTVSGNQVTVTNASGSCVLTATRSGDNNYEPVTSLGAPVTLHKASQVITFTTTPPAQAATGGTYTVAATASSGGAVAFSSLTGAVCTVNGSLVSFTSAGTCTVAANQGGNDNFGAAPQATQSINVGSSTTTYTFTGFFQPVDMPTHQIVWNQANAGRTVPVKWLLMLAGVPVSDASSFAGIFTSPVSCTTSGSTDAPIDQYVGTSGLQYLGDGSWQYNWSTQRNYAGTCRVLAVRFSDGTSSPMAYFKFSR